MSGTNFRASCATCPWAAASRLRSEWKARDRTRQDHHRGHQGSPHPHHPQRRRSWHRDARGARRVPASRAQGRLVLRAFHEGGQVNIEISDDGGGIDAERLKAKAVDARASITAEQAARMTEREVAEPVSPGPFHRAKGHQHLRPRRRHGRGQDQHREDRRHGRPAEHARQGHDC